MKIGNRNHVKMLAGEILDHLLKSGKLLPVHCEGPIILLIVNVEIDCIRRNLICAQAMRNLAHLCFGIITVA